MIFQLIFFIYLGIRTQAPTWYFVLIPIWALIKLFIIFIDVIKNSDI